MLMPDKKLKWCSTSEDISENARSQTIGHSNSSYDGRDCLLLRIFKVPVDVNKKYFEYTTKFEMKNCSIRAIYGCQVYAHDI
jgi:hypothetical protein